MAHIWRGRTQGPRAEQRARRGTVDNQRDTVTGSSCKIQRRRKQIYVYVERTKNTLTPLPAPSSWHSKQKSDSLLRSKSDIHRRYLHHPSHGDPGTEERGGRCCWGEWAGNAWPSAGKMAVIWRPATSLCRGGGEAKERAGSAGQGAGSPTAGAWSRPPCSYGRRQVLGPRAPRAPARTARQRADAAPKTYFLMQLLFGLIFR